MSRLNSTQIRTLIDSLLPSLNDMHKSVAQSRDQRRRGPRNRKVKSPNFMEGDFVLWGRREDSNISSRSKIAVRWLGPYRITNVLSPWHYELVHLVTKVVVEAHCTRMKVYADPSLNVTDELIEHAANSSGYVVDGLLDCRLRK